MQPMYIMERNAKCKKIFLHQNELILLIPLSINSFEVPLHNEKGRILAFYILNRTHIALWYVKPSNRMRAEGEQGRERLERR